MSMETKAFTWLFHFLLLLMVGRASVVAGARGKPVIFDVRNFGARADGRSDDSKALLEAWKAACGSSGVVKIVIPAGTYLVGPTKFKGPCKNVLSLKVHLQGILKATTSLDQYRSAKWVEFGWVKRLILVGGTFDGQGAASWPFNKCPKQKNCKVLPTSILFVNNNNTVVRGITSVNSKFFHIGILRCRNFNGSNIKIIAPANSPNTDGIHLERNTGVTLSRLSIGTGDDCVSVGHGNTDVTITGVKCGPGHGISVGSLGKYNGEQDVTGLVVKNCVIRGTTNGVRIKTWENSPSATIATNLTFENIVMKNVDKPILIDQQYCPYHKCDSSAPSQVKISNIKFKNISGTTNYPEAVTLRCSQGLPCKDVSLQDVSLKYVGGKNSFSTEHKTTLTSTCINVKPTFMGIQNPPPCL
ncbi:hypothetical protein KSP40_PGU003434 [Platanthera guangdongensis]|uniref:Exopolygalacturonase n=1 Tax=Platanthera guangdongensis TaxID=2320717 RepID=A0ABR2MF94_9ASPA